MQIGEEKEIEIQDFFELSKDGGIYEIETPQGWVEIGDLILKKNKECYLIRTESGRELGGSEDHYVETLDGWKNFKNLDVQNTIICTKNGTDQVVAKEYMGIEDTYDLEVKNDDHKYYANSIVSHNTGKTLICKVLAKELPLSVLYVLPSHFNLPNGVGRVCEMAQDLAPTLLILEDIDYIAKDREIVDDYRSIELMNKLDGIEEFGDIITIATTNLEEKLEKAIKNRPGRFDRVIKIGLPDKSCREIMLKRFTENFILDESVKIDSIICLTEGMSGAYIKNVCEMSAILAVDRDHMDNGKIVIGQKDFEDVIKELNDEDLSSLDDFKKCTGKGGIVGFGKKDDGLSSL